jgi:hypothetical protein
MARNLCIIAFWLALSAAANAVCTPEMIADLQKRGASPQLIAQMCGTQKGAAPEATNFGVCAFHGPVNVACVCKGPMGTFSGTSR